MAVSLADYCVLREEQRLRAMLWPSHLGEHDAHHESLRHDAEDRLHAHHKDRLGTLFGRRANTVADGVLRLNGEEEAGGE